MVRTPCQTSTLPLQTTNCAEADPLQTILKLKNREELALTSVLTKCVGRKSGICLSKFWPPGDSVKFTPVEPAS